MILLDLPVPPSVNRTRRIDRAGQKLIRNWERSSDTGLMASGQFKRSKRIDGPFELTVVLNELLCKRDPDNILKSALDYLCRLELITDDSLEYARDIRIVVGDAPQGCRLIVKAMRCRLIVRTMP